jgi:hypothetical protein
MSAAKTTGSIGVMPTTPIESRNEDLLDRCMLPPKHAPGAIYGHEKSRLNASGGSFEGEYLSELSFRALSVSALGTVASPARLSDPVARVTPDAEMTVHGLTRYCKPRA